MIDKRFGLSGRIRYRVYQWLAFALFLVLVLGGEPRWPAISLIGLLCAWIATFDSIGSDGTKRIFGLKPGMFQSIFGRKPGLDQ
jgi:hypothetical protein